MSTDAKPADAAAATPVAAAPAKSSKIGGILTVVLPTIFAAGAAYAGTRGAVFKAAQTVVTVEGGEHHGAGGHGEAKPPGPTLPLEPFLVTIFDANRKAHPMKMSIAVEFDPQTKGELKDFQPRIRDAVLAYVRTLTHEQATDPTHVEKMRAELVERCRAAGAAGAQKILVTDFVVQ